MKLLEHTREIHHHFRSIGVVNLCALLLFSVLTSCIPAEDHKNETDLHQKGNKAGDTALINQSLARIRDQEVPNDAVDSLLDSITIVAEKTGYRKGIAYISYYRGISLYRHNDYSQARDQFNSSLDIAKEVRDTLLWANCLLELGSVALTLGDDHLCLKLYYEALPLLRRIGNLKGLARVYNILGLYKSGQKEYDSAVHYYHQAMTINREIDNEIGLIHNKGNLGYLYEITGRYDQAENVYKELESLLIDTGDSINLPVIYFNFASLYQKKDQVLEAVLYLKKAISIGEKMADTALLANVYGNLGELFLAIHKLDSSVLFLRKSVECASIINDPETEMMAIDFLLQIDTLNGDYFSAVRKFDRILQLQDSTYSIKNKNNLKASELNYLNQQKDLQIESQNLLLKSISKQNRLYLIIFIISALTIVLILAIVWLSIKRISGKQDIYKQQILIKDLQIENAAKTEEMQQLKLEKIAEELKTKEREQVSHALAITQKNELLNQIYDKISIIIEKGGSVQLENLKSIISSIRMQITDPAMTDLFNERFSQVHSEFYSKLIRVHPDLTKSELKFCAYLKLNLTSHQISQIMNVSGEAIRKSRYRIRKKMKLSRTDSLEVYLSSF